MKNQTKIVKEVEHNIKLQQYLLKQDTKPRRHERKKMIDLAA